MHLVFGVFRLKRNKRQERDFQVLLDSRDVQTHFSMRYGAAAITNTSRCGAALAEKFTRAHECDRPNTQETFMDFHNNVEGIEIGKSNPNLILDELADLICERLEQGLLYILSDPNDPNSKMISSHGCKCN